MTKPIPTAVIETVTPYGHLSCDQDGRPTGIVSDAPAVVARPLRDRVGMMVPMESLLVWRHLDDWVYGQFRRFGKL